MQHPPQAPEKRPSSRRRLALIATGAFVALAAALVLLLPAIKARFPGKTFHDPSPGRTPKTLEERGREELDSIQISHLAGDSYTLRWRDGQLWLESDGELLEVSDLYAEELVKAATQLQVVDVVAEDVAEVREHLADMGLEPPQATATVRYLDGRVLTIELGSLLPETTYSYYRWSGDEGVYLCDSGVTDALSLTANRLPPVVQPVLAKTLIDRLEIRPRNGEKLTITFSADSGGWVSGLLRAPYLYPLSAEGVDALLTVLENFRLGTREGAVTAENRAELGFDNPLCTLWLHQGAGSHSVVNAEGQLVAEELPEQELTLLIGRAEGDYYYTCAYEGECYFINRFLVAALVEADPDQLITRNPADLGDASIRTLLVQTGTGSVEARVTRTERVLPNNQLETDENGDIVYDTVITLNGEAITEAQWSALLERLQALSVSGELDAGWTPGNAVPRWRITLTTAGGATRTIAAYPLDAFSDALVVDGVPRHYAHVEALETAMAEWMEKLEP